MTIDKNLFRYVWRLSRGEQLRLVGLVALSVPFYFASLNVPKTIVNDAIQGRAYPNGAMQAKVLTLSFNLPEVLGGQTVTLFDGLMLERLPYLVALSGFFLTLVLINGWFKYIINVRKGALGERLLQRIRLDLFSTMLRFTPESLQHVKPSEAATIINNEVEPIGGFVGDAFIQPIFLATQALTALTFILLQSVWLGMIAAGIIGVQALVIPKLRREQLALGKRRQIEARALAGQIGEVVEGIAAVHGHGTTPYEMARINGRLTTLFGIRYRLFARKFAVKFANNLLAQLTPFIFFSLGGYLALTGSLNVGQLVAVIAAYRDLPPPVKELIDWDQQRLDVETKYQQIVENFTSASVMGDEIAAPEQDLTKTRIEVQNLRVVDGRGQPAVEGLSLSLQLPQHVGLIADGGDAPQTLARVLGRGITTYSGTVRLGDQDLARLPQAVFGRSVAYAGPEPVIFGGTIRSNVAYGLNLREPVPPPSGESVGTWTDYGVAAAGNADELDARILTVLGVVGLDEVVYRFGLSGRPDAAATPDVAARIIDARVAVRQALVRDGHQELVEPFDPQLYNRNATVAENLMFGLPTGDKAMATLLGSAELVAALEREGLTAVLHAMGRSIAATMVEIFSGLPQGHMFFDRFSFISADDLPEFQEILERDERGAPEPDDRQRLVLLTFGYIEPRHRLGLIDDATMAHMVRVRHVLKANLPASLANAVEFYDTTAVCMAAPVLDNVLFGRITYGIADAEATVLAVVRQSVEAVGLTADVSRIGLGFQTGHGGRLISSSQRAALSLARSLIKRPAILILNGPFGAFSDAEAARLLQAVRSFQAGRSVVMVCQGAPPANLDTVVRFSGLRLAGVDHRDTQAPERETLPAAV